MFKDYYQILDVPFDASFENIKAAYRKQALIWHPDKHPEMDVKSIMQDINEAYAILKDIQTRKRYNQEYVLFKEKTKNKKKYSSCVNNNTNCDSTNETYNSNSKNHRRYYYEYTVKDETLNEDIEKARKYAEKLVAEFFSGLRKNSKLAAKGAWEGSKVYLLVFVVFCLICLVLRSCVE